MSILGGQCSTCCAPQTSCWSGVTPSTGSDAFYNNTPLAMGIEVGPAGMTLHSVTIYNDGLDQPLVAAVGGGYTNAPRCRIWSSHQNPLSSAPDDPCPDSSLVTLTPPSSFTGTTWTFTHAGYSLSSNTRYWVVMDSADVYQTGYWKFEDYGSATSECYFLSTFSSNAGGSWAIGSKNSNKWLMDVA